MSVQRPSPSAAESFLRQSLLLDIEVSPEVMPTSEVTIGLARDAWSARRTAGRNLCAALLDGMLDSIPETPVVMGHNLLEHDLPILGQRAVGARLLSWPVVDTLYLSPLAFPENPYHALLKGYKLCKTSVNDPVEDARLAGTLFADAWKSFRAQDEQRPGLLSFYAYCFARAAEWLGDRGGLAFALQSIAGDRYEVLTDREVLPLLSRLAGDAVCPAAVRESLRGLADRTPEQRARWLLGVAYVVAWLPVSGANSVIPRWVVRQIPAVLDVVRAWRETDCAVSSCAYCRETHDARVQLRAFFKFAEFRTEPADVEGCGLQAQIVEHGMRGGSHLAILPTGGGKSLCFQLPALVRNRRRGSLTIVLSPLQALMRDQVVNLREKTGADAAALYGLLTPLERGQVLRDVVMGDISVLYIAPEQLRNRSFRRVVEQREIGGWVFDEAHCLSKWGHDFRPDYLYAGRVIKEIAASQGVSVPPVACLTATAKKDVVEEICTYFKSELDLDLERFLGGVERTNLRFRVEDVAGNKLRRVRELCAEAMLERGQDGGAVVVYHATRRRAEVMASLLVGDGLAAAHFHGGLNAPQKKDVLDRFLRDELRVICATNAFGMGVDKGNVRLVVHADIPGTLENYLQEAGRAGRDTRPALCVLLYSESDVEDQFRMVKESEISLADMAQVLRGLRRAGRRGSIEGQEFQITSGELLRDEEVDTSFDAFERSADTRVKTAVSWLERARLVERNLNHTTLISAKPKMRSMAVAEARIAELKITGLRRWVWLEFLSEMLQLDPDAGLTVDQLAGLPSVRAWRAGIPAERRIEERVSREILNQLREMTKAGLVQAGTHMTAFLRNGVQKSSEAILEKVAELESVILNLLPAEAPDAEDGADQILHLRVLSQRLRDHGCETDIDRLATLLRSLAKDERCFGDGGRLTLRPRGRDAVKVRLRGTWQELREWAYRRRIVAAICLRALQHCIPDDARPSAELLIEFSLEKLVDAVRGDLQARPLLGQDPLEPVERVLLFLHDQGVIILQNGLAIFRAAMTIRIAAETKGRRYTKADYQPLREHYDGRTVQVHVMRRYAELGIRDPAAAKQFVHDYFESPHHDFLARHFPGEEKIIERPVSAAAFEQIVDELHNPHQQAVVTAPAEQNQLVLAGPGSGKTRTVVHRCAYLLRVLRVRRSSVLVLCFNRSTALELRRRLRDLLGGKLGGLQIHTYDGLAMRIAGRSMCGIRRGDASPDFAGIREEAVQMLVGGGSGEDRAASGGLGETELAADDLRDRLLRGYQFILVDEYQDIDASQYRLVSAIAGRTERDPDARLSILAVGDDDQNIYSFRASSNEFIERFEVDYKAHRYELSENYRSTRSIIAGSNRLIAHNTQRMKQSAIRMDSARLSTTGGSSDGPIRVHKMDNLADQSGALVSRLAALKRDRVGKQWNSIAVLASQWSYLEPLRVLCRNAGVPVRWAGETGVTPWRVRETRRLRALLRELPRDARSVPAAHLRAMLDRIIVECGANTWTHYLEEILQAWEEDVGFARVPASMFDEFMMEIMVEERQLAMAEVGVFLGTVHAAKGLEFDLVHVLDGGWRGPCDRTRMRRAERDVGAAGQRTEAAEARRRLFYVGMTRARSALHVFATPEHPFVPEIFGPGVAIATDIDTNAGMLVREAAGSAWPAVSSGREPHGQHLTRLSLAEVFIDFAGRCPGEDPTHAALASLRVGDELELRKVGSYARAFKVGGRHPLFAVKTAEAQKWLARDIAEIRVVAIVDRRREESGSEFRAACLVDQWEIPLVEIVWSG